MFFQHFGGGFSTGGSHPGQQQQDQRVQLPDVRIDIDATLEDLYNGANFRVVQKRQVLCHHCRGTGADDPNDIKPCTSCGGSGVKVKTIKHQMGFVQRMQTPCEVCGGKGKVMTSTCHACHGAKVESEEDFLTIWIEPGMDDGSEIAFPQQADEKPDAISGDVKFIVRTIPHKRFRRRGNDLFLKLDISLLEALVGFQKTFTHLDGRNITVARENVARPGTAAKIDHEGMPVQNNPSEHGDLYVEYNIIFPTSLTQEQKLQIAKVLGPIEASSSSSSSATNENTNSK